MEKAVQIHSQIKRCIAQYEQYIVERRVAMNGVDSLKQARHVEWGTTPKQLDEIDARMKKGEQIMRKLSESLQELGYTLNFFTYELEKYDTAKPHGVSGLYGFFVQYENRKLQ